MGCCTSTNKIEPEHANDDFEGPLAKRSCTDVLFLVFFLAFLGGMGYTAFLGIQIGNPLKLFNGVDSWGNVCNRENEKIQNVSLSGLDMSEKPNIYYYNFLAATNPDMVTSAKLCVKACPEKTMLTSSALVDFYSERGSSLCHPGFSSSQYHIGSSATDTCPPLTALTPHTSILNRCVPKTAIDVGKSVASGVSGVLNAIDDNLLDKVSHDIETTWKEILYLCGIALGVSIAVVIFMRFFAGVLIWTLVLGCGLGSLAGTAFCWYNWYGYKTLSEASANSTNVTFEGVSFIKLQETASQETVDRWLYISIGVSAAAFIILLVLIVMRNRIALVVRIFKEAGKAIGAMPLILLQPLWTMIILLASLAGLVYLFLYLETAGHPAVDESTGYVSFKTDELLFYMKWYHIFGILWILQFIIACQHMTIAGAIATWFFTRDKKNMSSPILKSMWRLIRYHLGTVAFGSFIIALVQLARLILGYIQKKLSGKTNTVVEFTLKCIQCCLWCFEKFLKFLNRNAYIEVAIYGYNFCRGAQKAFALIVANALRVAAINSVGNFCLFLGKVGTTAIVVVIGLELLRNNTTIHYIWAPLVIAGIIAFMIAHCFLIVYEMAIDTIFLCFCEDCERNDGVQKPYFMSKELMKYVDNSSEALSALKNTEKQRGSGSGGKANIKSATHK